MEKPVSLTSWMHNTDKVLRRESPGSDVPCGSCTKCCKGWMISLHAHENPDEYDTDGVDSAGQPVLRRQENGNCVYLIDEKCTIYDRRPETCRMFDCRVYRIASGRPGHPVEQQGAEMWRQTVALKHHDDFLLLFALKVALQEAGKREELDTIGKRLGWAMSQAKTEHFQSIAIGVWSKMQEMQTTDPELYAKTMLFVKEGA